MNLYFMRLILLAFGSTCLQAVAEELPGQQPRAADDWLYLAYGRGRFEAKAKIDVQAQAKERHELRCCSRQEKPGWLRTMDSCNVWHESDRLLGLDGATPRCFHAVTYSEAQAICTANGAYVCTKAEVESGCVKGSGCSHDWDWVWTSTDSPPGPQNIPGQETIPDDDYMFLACGSGAKDKRCPEGTLGVAKASEKHEVRCCSSRLHGTWMQGNNCNNWHESDLIDLNGNLNQCIHAATYAEAQQICAMNGAYVCTRDQIMQKCAQGSGCLHDYDLVWTSNRASPEDVAGYVARQSQASAIANVCTETKARVWGDPHFITFDNLKYDCQGHGEFVIAMSMGSDPLAIHGRFVRRMKHRAKPTVTSSVAVKVLNDVPVIHVSVPDQKVNGKCPFTFTTGNDETPVPNNDIVTFLKAYNGTANAFEKHGRTVIFTFPDQEARVQITAGGSNRCVLNTDLCLTPSRHGGAQNIVGLLGSPNGNKNDDWMPNPNKGGANTALPIGCGAANPSRQCKQNLNRNGHEWCMDNWCVGHADNSLWKPETHALYNQCDDIDPWVFETPHPAVVAACAIAENPEECETDAVAEIAEDVAEDVSLDDFLDTFIEEGEGEVLDKFLDSLIEDEVESKLVETLDATNAEDALDGFDGPVIIDANDPPPIVINIPPEFQEEFEKVDPKDFGTGPPTTTGTDIAKTNGDPHFTTWKGEHFEYHGQCDMILTKDSDFADGLGLEVQIRTKLVRFWSYIKAASIRIGNDVLEMEGSTDPDDHETHYWFNFEYQGEVTEIGGFPVSISRKGYQKRSFEIDLSSKYPGQKIIFATFREFVSVEFRGTAESFGNTVGMLGDYNTGRTLARDGVTDIDDYSEFGNEWQVLPSDSKLFHEMTEPQFPTLCIVPEDPRGDRRRRLEESTISMDEAEAACSQKLSDSLDIKDCVYDILATQDLDMVGAF